MVKRIADTLAEAGMGRADAPFNEMTGLDLSLKESISNSSDEPANGTDEPDGTSNAMVSGGFGFASLVAFVAGFVAI